MRHHDREPAGVSAAAVLQTWREVSLPADVLVVLQGEAAAADADQTRGWSATCEPWHLSWNSPFHEPEAGMTTLDFQPT